MHISTSFRLMSRSKTPYHPLSAAVPDEDVDILRIWSPDLAIAIAGINLKIKIINQVVILSATVLAEFCLVHFQAELPVRLLKQKKRELARPPRCKRCDRQGPLYAGVQRKTANNRKFIHFALWFWHIFRGEKWHIFYSKKKFNKWGPEGVKAMTSEAPAVQRNDCKQQEIAFMWRRPVQQI